MLDSLEDGVAELPEPDEPFAACSRWHCSSAAPMRPVQSGLAPVDAASPAAPVEDDMPLDEGEALLDEDGEVLLPPEALELSAPDEPELVLGLPAGPGLLAAPEALLSVPLELPPELLP